MKKLPAKFVAIGLGTIVALAAITIVWAANTKVGNSGETLQNRIVPQLEGSKVTLTNEQSGATYTTSTGGAGAPGASIGYQPVTIVAFSTGGLGDLVVPLSMTDPNSCKAPYTYNRAVDDCVLPPGQTDPAIPLYTLTWAVNQSFRASNLSTPIGVTIMGTSSNQDPSLATQQFTYHVDANGSILDEDLTTCPSCHVAPRTGAPTAGQSLDLTWAHIPLKSSYGTLHGTRFTFTLTATALDWQGNLVQGTAQAPVTLSLPSGSLNVNIQVAPMTIAGIGNNGGSPITWSVPLAPRTS